MKRFIWVEGIWEGMSFMMVNGKYIRDHLEDIEQKKIDWNRMRGERDSLALLETKVQWMKRKEERLMI